ncbi:MAG: hypothetical protein LUC43_04790 [Burkholderiales bacterium]|nr:hypothetical protein [Burkholderiales bacterium]
MGVDPGVSTVAAVAEDAVFLEELAPAVMEFDKRIAKVQRQMEMSKRATNPENYNEDGTVRKGIKSWRFTNHYIGLRWELRDLFRRKSTYVERSHTELTNKMTAAADTFLIEENNFAAMARRVKKTERSEKESVVAGKDGKKKTIHKFKRRKRLGRTVLNRAPAKFLAILLRKVEALGGAVQWIAPFKFRASQYRHDTDGYEKVPLSKRIKAIVGYQVQRDLYSAFLIKHSDPSGARPDRLACVENFSRFRELQDRKIALMKKEGISMKQCFGF